MPRSFHDIIPPEKKTIRNIPLPDRKRAASDAREEAEYRPKPRPVSDVRPAHPVHKEKEKERVLPPKIERERVLESDEAEEPVADEREDWGDIETFGGGGKRKGRSYTMWGAVAAVLLVLAFAISSLFSAATIKVTPRHASVAASGTFAASREASEDKITFNVIKVTRDEGKSAAASEERDVATKATGRIVIYNNNSSAPQGLVKNTRFESPDGLVFRIESAVTIPGATISNGEKVPGSVEATVVADQPGDKYNLGLTDFKVPGFKGDPKYETIFARSKTPMAGGFVGKAKVVEGDALAQVKEEVQFSLRQQLGKDVESQIPANSVIFEKGMIYSFEDLPQTDDGANTVKVNQRGVLYAIVFDKSALGRSLAERFMPNYGGGDVEIANPDELNFAIENPSFDPDSDAVMNFTLNGNANLVWQYDAAALKSDLSGLSKSDVDGVLAKYPSIESAEVIMRPFWKRSIPGEPDKISIVNALSSAD